MVLNDIPIILNRVVMVYWGQRIRENNINAYYLWHNEGRTSGQFFILPKFSSTIKYLHSQSDIV